MAAVAVAAGSCDLRRRGVGDYVRVVERGMEIKMIGSDPMETATLILVVAIIPIMVIMLLKMKHLEHEAEMCRRDRQQLMAFQRNWESTIKKYIIQKGDSK